MIGEDADYVAIVASVLPGHEWDYYMDKLPLAIGLQLRNLSLAKAGADLVPPGRTASAKGREILGEHAAEWVKC